LVGRFLARERPGHTLQPTALEINPENDEAREAPEKMR
jgi:hypothetical protein